MRVAIVTIVNDSFVKGAQVMIKSFLDTNSWFEGDIIVCHSFNRSPLSAANMKKLAALYPKTIFRNINESDYADINTKNAMNARFVVSYYTLEAFRITGYDRVLFLDSDMIILGDLTNLIKRECFVGIENTLSIYSTNKECGGKNPISYINGGVFSIPKGLLGERSFNELLEVAKPGHKKADQDTINKWILERKFSYYVINNRYNFMVRAPWKQNRPVSDIQKDEVRILHYAGKHKPWANNPNSPYAAWEKIWQDYYESTFGVKQ